MKIKRRTSSLKGRKMTGFRRRMSTKAGRKIINRQRAIAAGRPKKR
ncbi:MAG: 50S ribosomal protein L34 [Planctomycetes bacterium]|nr:50S ribosomal protein L34 [Planctomycetota bacterium]